MQYHASRRIMQRDKRREQNDIAELVEIEHIECEVQAERNGKDCKERHDDHVDKVLKPCDAESGLLFLLIALVDILAPAFLEPWIHLHLLIVVQDVPYRDKSLDA